MGIVETLRNITDRLDPAVIREGKIKTTSKIEQTPPTAAQVRRDGFIYGVQLGGSTNIGSNAYSAERLQILHQLYQAYITCPWVSGPIDLIARTATAGGLDVVIDDVSFHEDGKIPPEPPIIQRLNRLLRFTNPREDMIQLLRSCVIDLLLFGDAYVEIVTLLGEPVALYTLDATTITVQCDEHGEVSGYHQDVDGIRETTFKPEQVIHISLDAPRGGVYGVSPAQKALLPVTAWLFTEATIKECFRRGDPPRLHVDLGSMKEQDVRKWLEKYIVTNLGPKAVGTPVLTTGGGAVNVLDPRKVADYLAASRQLRDEIISTFGCPPAKLGIIESGNLGGGTAEGQDKSFRVNTIIPIQNLVLEKFNFHLLQQGFGIYDYHLEFGEIDFRDSKVVEEIRDMRLRNGSYVLNRYRDEIGEPPVDGGDTAVLIDRQNVVLWSEMAQFSKAGIAYKVKGTSLDVQDPNPVDKPIGLEKPEEPEVQLVPVTPVKPNLDGSSPASPGSPGVSSGPDKALPPKDRPGGSADATQGKPPREDRYATDRFQLNESWQRAYAARRKAVLKELKIREQGGTPDTPDELIDDQAMWDHNHHKEPDYRPEDLGLQSLVDEMVDPQTVQVDHSYQRRLHDNLVDKYAANPSELVEHYGLLAIRPDGSKFAVAGQHHTAAAVRDNIPLMPYKTFDSSGSQQEALVYRMYHEWHRKHHAGNPTPGGVLLDYERRVTDGRKSGSGGSGSSDSGY